MRPNIYQRGVVSIEFALGFMALWLLTIALMDLGLRNYSTSVVNFAVSEAARDVKVLKLDSEEAFAEHFRRIIKENSFSLWGILTKQGKLDVNVKHFPSVKSLADGVAPATSRFSSSYPIAKYEIKYTYQPLLGFSLVPATPVRRSVITIQERARNEK